MHWNPAVGIPLLIIGLIVLAAIWLFGQPRKPRQGKRVDPPRKTREARREPTFDGTDDEVDDFSMESADADETAAAPRQGELDVGMREELERLGATLAGERGGAAASTSPSTPAAPTPATAASAPTPAPADRPRMPKRSTVGRRPPDQPVERIVSLFVMARDGAAFRGEDLVVAMEKAGLEYGDLGIFHRLLDGKPEQGAVFSVANMVKPGSFEMADIGTLETPGLSFFMTLPGPLSALDAWDTMLPTAQRLAKLLDGLVVDEERNALGRQRIAHIRDDLRGWDRNHD